MIDLKTIHRNKEVSRIYSELRQGFFAYIHVTIPSLKEEDLEEIYDDAFMALCDNITSGKLQELTCSLQTYVNRIGRNKSIDYIRRNSSACAIAINFSEGYLPPIADEDFADIDVEREEEIYQLVHNTDHEKCRQLLIGFYWHRYSMEMLAELIGVKNADVAKTQKNRCLNQLKEKAFNIFQKKGLI